MSTTFGHPEMQKAPKPRRTGASCKNSISTIVTRSATENQVFLEIPKYIHRYFQQEVAA